MSLAALPSEIIGDEILSAEHLDILSRIVCRYVCKEFSRLIPVQSLPRDNMCTLTVWNNHLPILKWALSTNYKITSGNSLCNTAALRGNLEMLKYLRSIGCPWSSKVCAEAARGSHLDMIKWVRENGGQWNQKCSNAAAGAGAIDILDYMKGQQHKFDIPTLVRIACVNGKIDVLKWIHRKGIDMTINHIPVSIAVANGHLDIVKWMYAKGFPENHLQDVTCMSDAIISGSVEMCKWLFGRPGMELRPEYVIYAAIMGNKPILDLISESLALDMPEPVADAETGGFHNIIEYTIAQGHGLPPHTPHFTMYANYKMLRWFQDAGYKL